MSKLTRSAATMYALSLAGMEEASRLGQRDADLDHLFIALVTSEQTAGQVLRAVGITLRGAREAVAEQHAEQLRALGVEHAPPAPGPIVFHETGGYEWTKRAQDVLNKASARGNDGSASVVLRELLAEPSGLIDAVLARLGVSAGEIGARLDAAERIPEFGEVSKPGGGVLTRTMRSFVPAPVAEVWALLADPERMPEWEDLLAEVSVPEGIVARGLRPGDAWEGTAVTEFSDGKPAKLGPEMLRIAVDLLVFEEASRISWRLRYPDAPRANSRCVTITLEPAAGGTQLGIAFAWEPPAARAKVAPLRRLQRLLLRPAVRFLVWVQVTQLANSISRVFRSEP